MTKELPKKDVVKVEPAKVAPKTAEHADPQTGKRRVITGLSNNRPYIWKVIDSDQ